MRLLCDYLPHECHAGQDRLGTRRIVTVQGQEAKSMSAQARTGVFLCRCGERIGPLVDLNALSRRVSEDQNVEHCEILPYPCLGPGLDRMISTVAEKDLNRLIIAGCESRLMLKKFEKKFEPLELLKGQIDMVNLRGHIAATNDISPVLRAEKGARLIRAAAAEMAALSPTIQERAFLKGPVLIIGGGVASWAAAKEAAQEGLDFMMSPGQEDLHCLLQNLHWTYPGESEL
ncbi:MAG: hypothetical protein ACOCS8_00930, partial [Desulfovermiculus sp.]